jgi:hypothetical protein
LDGLHVHLLESCLELLVVRAGALMDLLHLSPWCALTSTLHLSVIYHACAASSIHLPK